MEDKDKGSSGILKNTKKQGLSTGSLAKPKASTLHSSPGKSTTATGGGHKGRSGKANFDVGDFEGGTGTRPRFG